MSGTQEKGNNNEEDAALNEDLVNSNTETSSKSGTAGIPTTSTEKTVGGIAKSIPPSSNVTEATFNKESGDTEKAKVNYIDKIDGDKSFLDSGKGSGDHTAMETDPISKAIINKKSDEITAKDDSMDFTDEDMELKWDDDDDDEDIEFSANISRLTEEQLLQDDSIPDVIKTNTKDDEPTDLNILGENSNADTSKAATDNVIYNKEIKSSDTEIPKMETANNEGNKKNDVTNSLVTEDGQEKTVEVTQEASVSSIKELLADVDEALEEEEDKNNDSNQEVAEIMEILQDIRSKSIVPYVVKNTEFIGDGDNDKTDDVENKIDDDDKNKVSEGILLETVDKIDKTEMDVSMDVNEEELLKDNNDDKDKIVENVEKQVLDDESNKIDKEKPQVADDNLKNDKDQGETNEELPKDDENQIMDMDEVVDDQNDKVDQISTAIDDAKSPVANQDKIDDDGDQIPSNFTDEVAEKGDRIPESLKTSDIIDCDSSKEEEDIELVPEDATNVKNNTDLVPEGKLSENIDNDKILDEENKLTIEQNNAKSIENLINDLTSGDVAEKTEVYEKETKTNSENEELPIVPSKDNNLTEKEITESSKIDKNIQEKEISSETTLERDTASKIICLDDSPVQVKKPHSLHKPDAMLEIPSQDLIDIDEELSIIDQSDSPEDKSDSKSIKDVKDTVENSEEDEGKVVKDIKDMVEDLEKNKREVVKDIKDSIEDSEGKEKDVEVDVKETVPETVEEGMERMFAEDPVKEAEAVASTSKDIQPASLVQADANDIPEMTDSLGLLAESARVTGDDDNDDADDDDDDHYESSNQVSPYQSDDSNAPHSEIDVVREREQQQKDTESPGVRENEFQFTISSVESASPQKGIARDMDTESVPLEQQQMDIDTVKLSDTSDNEDKDQIKQLTQNEMKARDEKTPEREPKTSPSKSISQQSPAKPSPDRVKKLGIQTLQQDQIVNIVDLQESSSSEDEIPEEPAVEDSPPSPDPVSLPPSPDARVTTINIPSGIEVMTSGGTTSELVTKEGEIVVSNIPKPKPQRPARLNTSEVSIKTVSNTEPMVIPETMINLPPETQIKPKLGLEIFSLDSDEEESAPKATPPLSPKLEVPDRRIKCMNYSCTSDNKVTFIVADARVTAFYEAGRKKRTMVCQTCADVVYKRAEHLIEGIKDFTPLLDLQMSNQSHELVEISDSESEDEEEADPQPDKQGIGEKTAKFLEDNLAEMFNSTWKKYELDARLRETQILLEEEMDQIERETKDLDSVFASYQQVTDNLRRELYAAFSPSRAELPALTIVDKPGLKYVGHEPNQLELRGDKRRKSSVSEQPTKRPAIPLGYAPLDDSPKDKIVPDIKISNEEDKDISVVRLSMELAPADLPPPGSISRPPLRVGMPVYAMKNAFGPWLKGRILEIQPRVSNVHNSFSVCRVKFDHKTKTNAKILPARCVAYAEPSDVRMTIGTRLIALFKDSNKRESYYSGVVAEIPNPVNNYRYLVFFDDGYAQYVHHPFTRLVCESSPLVWEEVHPFSREFVMEYLLKYPERPMVRLHEGQHLKTEWNGKWWPSRVSRVDASLAQVMFVGDGRREWIYRGSTRLAPLYLALRAAERHRPRPMPRSKAQAGSNMPYVEYTRSDEPEAPKQQPATAETEVEQQQQQTEEIRHQRAVAKKSTVSHVQTPPQDVPKINVHDSHAKESRVVYYTPKNAVRPYKMTPHRCGPQCKRSDVLTLKELRTYNPLAKPLLSGWERQLVRFKGNKEVMYRAPCGRRLRNMAELHHYLRLIDCELPVDLFDFNPLTHCLAEFVMHRCLVGKKDLSHGKENVPVPCVNFFDESLPEFCSYNTERTPTAGVPLNLDPEFLCGCDCTDDCVDKEKCACWRMTMEGARTIGLEGPSVGYVYKRLPEPLPSGIYECNSRCKCRDTCLNRVAQHPLQLKLQVFKTENRGWGIRALNDVPKGSFLCVYAGNLLTDATANLDGLNEGDEYLAELDYIEVVEQMKEGYEEDIPEADKKLDKKESKQEDDDEEESESSTSEDDDTASKTDKEDDDFRPGHIGLGVMEFNKRLRRRGKKVKEEPPQENTTTPSAEKKDPNGEEDCITISDDEEVREPSSFSVKAGMGANDFVSKYRSVRSYFGEDEACYIMDAKVQGNIGRYLNHSCCPNVFVQNVFVDTHDPRFPWVAFFALSHIKAGTELTWNYNYDVGSVPGKVLYCYCGAPNCRGRLL